MISAVLRIRRVTVSFHLGNPLGTGVKRRGRSYFIFVGSKETALILRATIGPRILLDLFASPELKQRPLLYQFIRVIQDKPNGNASSYTKTLQTHLSPDNGTFIHSRRWWSLSKNGQPMFRYSHLYNVNFHSVYVIRHRLFIAGTFNWEARWLSKKNRVVLTNGHRSTESYTSTAFWSSSLPSQSGTTSLTASSPRTSPTDPETMQSSETTDRQTTLSLSITATLPTALSSLSAKPRTSHGQNLGIRVGIAMGSLTAIALVVLGLLYFRKWSNYRTQRAKEESGLHSEPSYPDSSICADDDAASHLSEYESEKPITAWDPRLFIREKTHTPPSLSPPMQPLSLSTSMASCSPDISRKATILSLLVAGANAAYTPKLNDQANPSLNQRATSQLGWRAGPPSSSLDRLRLPEGHAHEQHGDYPCPPGCNHGGQNQPLPRGLPKSLMPKTVDIGDRRLRPTSLLLHQRGFTTVTTTTVFTTRTSTVIIQPHLPNQQNRTPSQSQSLATTHPATPPSSSSPPSQTMSNTPGSASSSKTSSSTSDKIITPTRSSPSSATTITTSAPSTASSASQTNSSDRQPPQPGRALSEGVKIGIAAGGGMIILILVIIALCLRRKYLEKHEMERTAARPADLNPPPYLHLSIVTPEKTRSTSKGWVDRRSVASIAYSALSPMSFVMRQSDTESTAEARTAVEDAVDTAAHTRTAQSAHSSTNERRRMRALPPLPKSSKRQSTPTNANKLAPAIPITPFLTRALKPQRRNTGTPETAF
ncbi:hypothetical protein BD310DRAFT_950442 [Dichomitus squalens]|uniref:Uncharacterized protein n=1 Tax=Dichomitus squalens TaxID=114155 RepID=A0A4Q9PNX4_9APHY|nr:hypothetical protein BD310DRAFT_950442 [Dichomitus squalens]